jgi:hypothetical protein
MGILLAVAGVALLAVAGFAYRKYTKVKRQRDELAEVAAVVHETNYRLSCTMFGKSAVERAIREAGKKGTN